MSVINFKKSGTACFSGFHWLTLLHKLMENQNEMLGNCSLTMTHKQNSLKN